MMIAGDEDVAAGAVSFRFRDGHQDNGVPVATRPSSGWSAAVRLARAQV